MWLKNDFRSSHVVEYAWIIVFQRPVLHLRETDTAWVLPSHEDPPAGDFWHTWKAGFTRKFSYAGKRSCCGRCSVCPFTLHAREALSSWMTIAVARAMSSRGSSTACAVAGFQQRGQDSNHCRQCCWLWQLTIKRLCFIETTYVLLQVIICRCPLHNMHEEKLNHETSSTK